MAGTTAVNVFAVAKYVIYIDKGARCPFQYLSPPEVTAKIEVSVIFMNQTYPGCTSFFLIFVGQ